MENEVVAPDTVETPAPEAPAVEVKAEPSRADTIREAMKQSDDKPPRLARAPKEAKEPKFPTEKTEAPKMAEMPKSLKRELKEHWERAPSELQQAIAQRDADYEKGIASYKTRDAEARQITEQFAPYEWICGMRTLRQQRPLAHCCRRQHC